MKKKTCQFVITSIPLSRTIVISPALHVSGRQAGQHLLERLTLNQILDRFLRRGKIQAQISLGFFARKVCLSGIVVAAIESKTVGIGALVALDARYLFLPPFILTDRQVWVPGPALSASAERKIAGTLIKV